MPQKPENKKDIIKDPNEPKPIDQPKVEPVKEPGKSGQKPMVLADKSEEPEAPEVGGEQAP